MRDLLRSPFSSRSVFARAALAEQRLRPLVVYKGPPREGARQKLCGFFFFLAAEGIGGRGHSAPRPRPQSSRPFAQAPVGGPSGAAGRRPPCPNGALLEKNGRVTRREEAAGASRWGLGSENRPSRRCAENNRCQAPGIFRSVSGPNSYVTSGHGGRRTLHRGAVGGAGGDVGVVVGVEHRPRSWSLSDSGAGEDARG